MIAANACGVSWPWRPENLAGFGMRGCSHLARFVLAHVPTHVPALVCLDHVLALVYLDHGHGHDHDHDHCSLETLSPVERHTQRKKSDGHDRARARTSWN